MKDSLSPLAQLAAQYEVDLRGTCKQEACDPIVIACFGLSNLTLDLIWALRWIDTLTDRLGKDGMVGEFMADLKERSEKSRSLQFAAQEANLP